MRDKLNKKFKILFKREKKPYFPAPCSEYDSSATVTLSSFETCANESTLKIKKRDYLRIKFKKFKQRDKEKDTIKY